MTAQIPEERRHVADLLPAYVNGQLDAASASSVREHLVSCAQCRLELASWESIKGAAHQVFAATPLPSARVMSQVWTKIEAAEQTGPAERWSPARALRRFWLVCRTQVPLIHKSIWIASPLVCLFGLVLTLLMNPHIVGHRQLAGNFLVLCIVIVGAAGSAFIYGSSIDPGFELTISTPTSVRLVMLCRMAIVLGYNLLLGMLASAVFAAIYGGSLWGFAQLWVGPLCFLSSFCLTISLFVGSTFALICTAVLEVLQTFPASIAYHLGSLPLLSLDLEPTSPALFIGALLLIAFAVLFVPRQPRLAS
jgi:hypothetical protein